MVSCNYSTWHPKEETFRNLRRALLSLPVDGAKNIGVFFFSPSSLVFHRISLKGDSPKTRV